MRGKPATKRKMQPDQVYNDPRVSKFINYVMLAGKKDKAQKIVYQAISKASQKLGVEPMVMFEKAMNAVKPEIEVRSRRVGGATYQIPVPVPKMRGDFLAMNWIIEVTRKRSGKPMADKLADELVNAYNEEGDAIKKRENTLKMAEANRAFAHFRW